MNNSIETLVKVGKVSQAHGIKGELFVFLFAGRADWLDRLENLNLRLNGKDFQLPLTSATRHKSGLIVSTPKICTRNEAETWKGADFYIPKEYLISKPGESIFLSEIDGFEVIVDAQITGAIVGFSSNGAQDLLKIKKMNGKVSEIPFVEAFIANIDFEKKQIHLSNLPEGLLENED